MKKRTVFIFLFLAIFCTIKAQEAVVATIDNTLYQYVDNPISISIPGVNPDNVWLTAENAEIKKIGGVYYFLLVTEDVRQITLIINKIENKDTIFIRSHSFKVFPIFRYLDLIFFGKSPKDDFLYEMSKAELKVNNYLRLVYNENFPFDQTNHFTIIKFDIAFGNENNAFSTTINGNKIPENILQKILKDLMPGDEIKISNIEAKYCGVLSSIYTIKIK